MLNYRPPKEDEDETDIITKFLYNKGCAPEVIEEKLQKFRDAKEVKVKLEKKEDENLQGGRRVRVERETSGKEKAVAEAPTEIVIATESVIEEKAGLELQRSIHQTNIQARTVIETDTEIGDRNGFSKSSNFNNSFFFVVIFVKFSLIEF